METTTRPIVHPAVREFVQVDLPRGLTIFGVVTETDGDSVTMRKVAEWDGATPVELDDADGPDLWTLFDVEQADARCVVTAFPDVEAVR